MPISDDDSTPYQIGRFLNQYPSRLMQRHREEAEAAQAQRDADLAAMGTALEDFGTGITGGEQPKAWEGSVGRIPRPTPTPPTPLAPAPAPPPRPAEEPTPTDSPILRSMRAQGLEPQGPTPALIAGQYRDSSPDWGMDLSQAQIAQDFAAREALAARHAQRLGAIDAEDQARGDPMAKQMAARQKDLAYEGMMPYGATSRIAASYAGDHPLAGLEILQKEGEHVTGERQPTLATNAQAYALEQQGRARLKPDDELDLATAQAGNAELRRFMEFKTDLQAQVDAGRKTQAQAQQELSDAMSMVGFRQTVRQRGNLGPWAPKRGEDDFLANLLASEGKAGG